VHAGKDLKDALNNENNDKLKVRLSSAVVPADALAIDVLYHRGRWTDHVSHMLRLPKHIESSMEEEEDIEAKIDTVIEFMSTVDGWLENGNVFTMASIEKLYCSIARENGIQLSSVHRKNLKHLIKEVISGIEFLKRFCCFSGIGTV